MCGIAGVAIKSSAKASEHQLIMNRKLLQGIIDSQRSRGPDNQFIESVDQYNHILVGHNRLSIIDTSTQSHQPMWDEKRRYCLVFNGMIYNYKELRQELAKYHFHFNTAGDTEVLLKAYIHWGKDCVNYLNGMFAFAIVDLEKNIVFLARDRFGVKPLFYYCNLDTLVFASSTKILAKHFNCKPNSTYLAKGLMRGVYEDESPDTAYEKIYSLQAGCTITFDYNNATLYHNRYYNLLERSEARINSNKGYNQHDLIEQIQNEFEKAVKLRLRSDVPVGISLSGGLDSTLIASIATQDLPGLHGFHYGHPSDPNSEGLLVKQTSDYCKLKTLYIHANDKELIDSFIKTINDQDAPFSSLSVVSQNIVFQEANRQGIKVMLGGQGADEAFMGYRKFMLFYLQHLLYDKKYFNCLKLFGSLIPTLAAELPRYKQYLFASNHYKSINDTLLVGKRDNLTMKFNSSTNLLKRQCSDILSFSLPTLLRYEDRNSMGNQIETRLPFIDYQLVEHALALPTSLKINKGYGKWILRLIAKDRIPESIRMARYKRGFDVKTKPWIDAGLGELLRSDIQKNITTISHYINYCVNLKRDYNDSILLKNPQKIREIILLSWLSQKI